MNGSSTINYPINEQLIGKFHVDKLPTSTTNHHDETITNTIQRTPSITDESACASRFQMIRVDRNFGRGRWKVNDYEPPENTSISTIVPVNTLENEPMHLSNTSTLSNASTITNAPISIPTAFASDSNATSSAALAASVAAAAAAAFQQHQQRLPLGSTPTMVPTANVPPPTGLLHAYPSAALPNQPYILPNHPQFSYYAFYPPHYSAFANSWAAALAASNPYLPPPSMAPPHPQTALNDTVPDMNGENTVISSASFLNPTNDHLQNAQLAAAPFLYAAHHSHSPFVPQGSTATSPYATIPSYHPMPHPPTILPSNQPPQSLPLSQIMSHNINDAQQAPILSSPKHDATKTLIQHSSGINTPKTKPTVYGINNDPSKSNMHMTDLISSTPSLINSQQAPSSLISPLTTTTSTATLSDIWPYATTSTPLNLTQTAAQTAVAAMGLLNNENSKNTEIAKEILKELTTPTKQNNTTDIDNKISAAMDLVKMHLLSAVREEVTDLRQQIRTLNEKINNVEHENVFLRQHVPSEIYAQYIPSFNGESINSTTTVIPSISSSLPIPMTSLSSLPSSIAHQASLSTINSQPLSSITNFPTT